jgi:hypothetical protein
MLYSGLNSSTVTHYHIFEGDQGAVVLREIGEESKLLIVDERESKPFNPFNTGIAKVRTSIQGRKRPIGASMETILIMASTSSEKLRVSTILTRSPSR